MFQRLSDVHNIHVCQQEQETTVTISEDFCLANKTIVKVKQMKDNKTYLSCTEITSSPIIIIIMCHPSLFISSIWRGNKTTSLFIFSLDQKQRKKVWFFQGIFVLFYLFNNILCPENWNKIKQIVELGFWLLNPTIE